MVLEWLLAPTLGWALKYEPVSARRRAYPLERWKLRLELKAAWEQEWRSGWADHSVSDRTLRLEVGPKWQ